MGATRTLTRLGFSALVVLSHLNAGCGKPTGESTATTGASRAQTPARVMTVTPERTTLRRTSEQPGQIEAIEVTPIHAKLAGYVGTVSVDIGDRVRKGQVMAELRVPEVEADAKQKRAMMDQAQAEQKQAEATVEVSQAGVATAEAKVTEIQAGIRRSEADVARWRSEFTRIDQLVREHAQTEGLLDETRNKLRAAEATSEEVQAQVKSAEAALSEARALLDKARGRSDRDVAYRSRPIRRRASGGDGELREDQGPLRRRRHAPERRGRPVDDAGRIG